MRTWLLDTGPLVAFLDAGDPEHGRVVKVLSEFDGRLATSSAVITEAMHFVSAGSTGSGQLAAFVSASGLSVHDFCRPPELDEAVRLMDKYSDLPMDFADATLVLLAEGLAVEEVATLDRRGFSAYRTRQGRPFRLVLGARPTRRSLGQ